MWRQLKVTTTTKNETLRRRIWWDEKGDNGDKKGDDKDDDKGDNGDNRVENNERRPR